MEATGFRVGASEMGVEVVGDATGAKGDAVGAMTTGGSVGKYVGVNGVKVGVAGWDVGVTTFVGVNVAFVDEGCAEANDGVAGGENGDSVVEFNVIGARVCVDGLVVRVIGKLDGAVVPAKGATESEGARTGAITGGRVGATETGGDIVGECVKEAGEIDCGTEGIRDGESEAGVGLTGGSFGPGVGGTP